MTEIKHSTVSEDRNGAKSSDSWLSTSIILGALIISASLLYGTKTLSGKIDALRGAPAAVKTAQTGGQQAAQEPTGPVEVIERNDAPFLGDKNAKVTIVEFSDFQCPFCQRFFNDAYKQIKSKYVDTGKVKLVFRHYPLAFHQNAQKAGEAAECAARQGKFWEYHDVLFAKGQADGTGLAVSDLKKYADEMGLNNGTMGFGRNKFNQCLDGGETADIVKKDLADGQAATVSGTPTLFVNGQKIVGAQPMTVFESAIEEALKQ